MTLLTAILIAADETAEATETAQTGPDWLMIGLIAVLGVMVFFMFRNNKKRKQEQETLQKAMLPGVEVMTSFGLFGTLVSVDDLENTAEIEVSPGNVVKVHRQTLSKVVDPSAAAEPGSPRSVEEAAEIAEREQQARESGEAPKYGERIEDDENGPKQA